MQFNTSREWKAAHSAVFKGVYWESPVERPLLALTNEGDVVLDPFGDVGSSVIAAVKQGRMGIMCEQESQYVQTARKRLRDYANGTLKLSPLGQPIYIPPGNGNGLRYG